MVYYIGLDSTSVEMLIADTAAAAVRILVMTTSEWLCV